MEGFWNLVSAILLSLLVLFMAVVFILWGFTGMKERRLRYRSFNPLRLSWTFHGQPAVVVSFLIFLSGAALLAVFLFIVGQTLLSLW